MDGLFQMLLDPLSYGFMVRAFLVSALVGIICPIVGSYVVMRGLAFMGDALAHSIFPGVVLALLVGVSPLAGAVAAGIVVAFLIGYVSRRTGVSEDTSIGILFAGLFAIGVAVLTASRNVTVNVEDLLLGQVLGVSPTDVYLTFGLAVIVIGVLYAFHKELVFSSFDPLGATVSGLPTGALTYLLLILLALVIVIALQAVGVILVMAMLVTPAATSYLLVRRFVPMMLVSAVLGVVSTTIGLYLSFYLNIASGSAMVIVATTLFAGVAVLRRRSS